MAALFDTTVAVLLLCRNPPEETAAVIHAARAEIEHGSAILPVVGVAELLVGERTEDGAERLAATLARIPSAVLAPEAARRAGLMGAFLASAGAPIPFPDLLIAATALWLEIPLLTWDGDYSRARSIGRDSTASHPGAGLWLELQLHPASRGA